MIATIALIFTLLTAAPVQNQQVDAAVPPVEFSWLAAYDHLLSDFERSLIGTLELDETTLRFRSATNFSWEVLLSDVVGVQEARDYGGDVRALAIETADGLTRYVALLDSRDMFFEKPDKVLDVLRKKGLSPVNVQQLAAAAERNRQ